VDPVYFALVAAGMGALWWRHMRFYQRRQQRALGTVFDGDAEVALHVAAHEAHTRGDVAVSSIHVLYGLLQDETIANAVREIGSDPSALEDRVLAVLDDKTKRDPIRDDDDVQRVCSYAAAHASHAGRRATARDLWAYLRGSEAANVLEPPIAARVLFQLCHGSEQAPAIEGTANVNVVLRNDDYTTQAFVTHILEDVFGLSSDDANARMMQTHTEGRAIIGRYRPDEARTKIEEVRTRAKAAGFPLWIGYEPV